MNGMLEASTRTPVGGVSVRTVRRSLPTVRRLGNESRGQVYRHFLHLADVDRRARFMGATSDRGIQSYVAKMDLAVCACFGAFDAEGALVSLTEGIPYRVGAIARVEAACSTLAAWRGLGLARRGFEALKSWCSREGIEHIELHCDARNSAMRALLSAFNATTCVEQSQVDAMVCVSRRCEMLS